jgi:3-hydroxyisobutyrate dehydrogenase
MMTTSIPDLTAVSSPTRHARSPQTPLLDMARARYSQAAEAGLTARDDSRVIETYAPSLSATEGRE